MLDFFVILITNALLIVHDSFVNKFISAQYSTVKNVAELFF